MLVCSKVEDDKLTTGTKNEKSGKLDRITLVLGSKPTEVPEDVGTKLLANPSGRFYAPEDKKIKKQKAEEDKLEEPAEFTREELEDLDDEELIATAKEIGIKATGNWGRETIITKILGE